ncbi:hypothetical protein GCM10028781_35170 [Nostocoides australiense]
MRLTPAHGQVTHRVSRISRGPLDPPPRVATPTDVTDWGRYDIPGGRTGSLLKRAADDTKSAGTPPASA